MGTQSNTVVGRMEKKGAAPLGATEVNQTVDASGANSPVIKPKQEVTQNSFKLSVKPTINLDGKAINGSAGRWIALGISTAVSIYSLGYLHGYETGKLEATGEEETEADNNATGAEGEGKNASGGEPQKINGVVPSFVNNPFY